MYHQPASRATIDSRRQSDTVSMAASRAILRRVRWIHFDHCSTSFFRFEDHDHLEKANRKGDEFQCQECGHRGDADQIAAQNQKSRYDDRRITLYTPKETVREILLKDYYARLEHPNTSKEKIRKMTVPGQTLERDETPGPKSSRQSKSKTAADKKTKSAAMK